MIKCDIIARSSTSRLQMFRDSKAEHIRLVQQQIVVKKKKNLQAILTHQSKNHGTADS
jgi:hypothetical protein